MASDLVKQLVEHLSRRDLFHISEFARQADTIMRAFGRGAGWEFGPGFDDPKCDVFAIAINGSLKNKQRLDRLHSLPVMGNGFKIVSGLLPRDAEQVVIWEGEEIRAQGWTFDFKRHGEKVQVLVSTPGRQKIDLAVLKNMIIGEIGEINYGRHVEKVLNTLGTHRSFETFAASFVEEFPDCVYAESLRKKVGGLVTRVA